MHPKSTIFKLILSYLISCGLTQIRRKKVIYKQGTGKKIFHPLPCAEETLKANPDVDENIKYLIKKKRKKRKQGRLSRHSGMQQIDDGEAGRGGREGGRAVAKWTEGSSTYSIL